MVKENVLRIRALDCSSLTVGFSGTFGIRVGNLKNGDTDVRLTCDRSERDVDFQRPLVQPKESFEVEEEYKGCRKLLVVNQFTRGKDSNEEIINPLLEGNMHVLALPSNWFVWKPHERTFMDHYTAAVESIPESMKEDLSYLPCGNVQMVLRPSNLTHGILAFRVVNPKLFRFVLFEIINNEVKAINERRAAGKYVKDFEDSIREKIRQCGLEVISGNTFGQEGVYGDKYTDPASWVLTPYIEGIDVRVIKGANNFWIHTGWHELKEMGASIIEPRPLTSRVDGAFLAEVAKVMDNVITPVAGSMDLRRHKSGRMYFLETSHCYSSERYSDEFVHEIRDNVISLIIKKHKELIGDFNEGWEERYDELEKQMKGDQVKEEESLIEVSES